MNNNIPSGLSEDSYLKWIADNMISFRPISENSATMVYADGDMNKSMNYAWVTTNGKKLSSLDLLKQTINAARKEMVKGRARQKEKEAEERRKYSIKLS
jgi:hypothetical protein